MVQLRCKWHRKAVVKRSEKTFFWLEALATAYAECGNYPLAVPWQKKVLAAQTDELFLLLDKQRSSFYEQGKPFRYPHVKKPKQPKEETAALAQDSRTSVDE